MGVTADCGTKKSVICECAGRVRVSETYSTKQNFYFVCLFICEVSVSYNINTGRQERAQTRAQAVNTGLLLHSGTLRSKDNISLF